MKAVVLGRTCPQCGRVFAMTRAAPDEGPSVDRPELFHVPKDAWIGLSFAAKPDAQDVAALVLCSTQCMKEYVDGGAAPAAN